MKALISGARKVFAGDTLRFVANSTAPDFGESAEMKGY